MPVPEKFLRTAARRALLALGAVSVPLTLLPLLPMNWWWLRVGDFPRVQLLAVHVICACGLLPFFKGAWPRAVVAALVACIGIQAYWIFPYTALGPREVQAARLSDPDRRVRVLAANVLQDNVGGAPALLRIIAEESPDVVVLCEVDARWLASLDELRERLPHYVEHPLDNTYGIALYTHLRLGEAEVRELVEEGVPSIDAVVYLPSGRRVRLFAVHPHPPRPGQSTTNRDAELVLVGREFGDEETAIVAGDFNDVGWSRTTSLFQEVSGLLDPRNGRGLYTTYHAESWFWRYPLDHVFHTDDFRVVRLATLDAIGSDHLPLLVELSHEPQAEAEQEAPRLGSGDVEDAQEAVRKAERADEG